MKITRIIVAFLLTLFTLTSCNENKAKNTNTETVVMDSAIISNNNNTLNESQTVQNFDLFFLNDLEESTGKKVGFISLSDKYYLSEHPDSLAIPDLKNIKDKKQLQYFVLNTEYKKRFFTKTRVSNSDSLFIYDYSVDTLLSFSVKNLNVGANLNGYEDINNYPFDQYDYEIGFEINKKSLQKLSKYYSNILVFVGKQNPFTKGQMKPIIWKKINSMEFPITKSKLTNTAFHKDTRPGNVYLSSSDKYNFFIQAFTGIQDSSYIIERHVMVIDKKNENLIIERIFGDSEGTRATPLNFGIDNPEFSELKQQWTGKLFKDKPEVIFGFEWVSFGCPNIIFLNSKEKDIFINCDNRH